METVYLHRARVVLLDSTRTGCSAAVSLTHSEDISTRAADVRRWDPRGRGSLRRENTVKVNQMKTERETRKGRQEGRFLARARLPVTSGLGSAQSLPPS